MSHTDESNTAAGKPGMPGMTNLLIAVAAAIGVGAFYALMGEDGESVSAGTTFVAKRGPLEILVIVGGDIVAQETQEIKSQVEGMTTILYLEEEGSRITKEDVEDGKLLVMLDSAHLQDRLDIDELSFQTTTSDRIEREHQVALQISMNEANIRQAQLALRFGLMDLQKFLGEGLTNELLTTLALDKKRAEIEALIRSSVTDSVSGALETFGILEKDNTGGRIGDMATDAQLLKGNPAAAARGEDGARPGGGRQGRGGWQGRGQGGPGWRPGGPGGGNFDPERMRKMMESGNIPEEALKRMKENGVDLSRFGKGKGQAEEERESTEEEFASVTTKSFTVKLDSEYEALRNLIDFSQYADLDTLQDGRAKQDLRQRENQILTTKEQLELARTTLEGTKRLFEQNFANRSQLDHDQASFNSLLLQLDSSKTENELYKQYEFVQQAYHYLSEYEERLMDLQRVHTENYAELTQARTRLLYKIKSWEHEKRELEELREQILACKMYAERPGLIVYGGGRSRGGGRYGGQNDQIEEGSTVRERQTIMNIPDMTSMAIKVQIHESAVQKVLPKQRVRMRVEAERDVLITGYVERVSAVADSGNMWMQPDLKEYPTTVIIDGEYEWLKPGMSAEVEIIVEVLEDVLYVPLQAVSFFGDSERAVYVAGADGPERRIVETGSFSDDVIEIIEGLSEGEQVYLRIPDSMRTDENIMSTAL